MGGESTDPSRAEIAVLDVSDVAIVPDPPLARTLYGSVDIGKMIPEDLFHAVAQLLAYVYRVAGARKTVAA